MSHVLKRVLDFVVALAGLLVLAPIMAAIAVAIRLSMGSPVFFRQQRPGLLAQPFTLLKFRTMTNARSADGALLPDSQRLTSFGRFLRRFSLDELPQLVNVLRGQMSLVGPRPLFMQYLERYSPAQARRHDMSPGITGWAQVHGRNATTWEERFAHDLWYVDHWSLALDLRILAMTLVCALRGDGVFGEHQGTMPEFMGSSRQQAAGSGQ
jgi:lipopolysaccharide/colanic/teichoic acid biosynthesis glycosyltransferase